MSLPYNQTMQDLNWCSKDPTGDVYHRYCDDSGTCDNYFLDNNVTYKPGIPGITSGVIKGKAY